MARSRLWFLVLILGAVVIALLVESGLWSPRAERAARAHTLLWAPARGPVIQAQVPASTPKAPAATRALARAPATGACTSPTETWQLAWGDSFSGPLDRYRWHALTGRQRKNGEVEDYRAANVFDSQGDLVLHTARQGPGYSSGAVDTRGTVSLLYGKVVIRARLPRGHGIWPAFWLRPTSGSLLPEIDMMEMVGDRPNIVDMTLHWLSPFGPTHTYVEHQGPDLSQGFHTYTLVWLPGQLRWYLDGQLILDVTAHVPDVPMYLTLDTAVGSSWGGYPSPSTVLPQDLRVDYVQVYRYGHCSGGRFVALRASSLQSSGDARVAVFVLHQISNSNPGPYDITPRRLAWDISFLQRRHVRFMTLPQFLAYQEGRWQPHGPWALLTFDDGYSSIYRNAAPILGSHGVPATLFLIGSRLGTESFWLSTSEVQDLARSGYWSIEAHTYAEHHMQAGQPALQVLAEGSDLAAVRRDIGREQALLSSLTGKQAYAFAFPYGYRDPWLIRAYSRTYVLLFDSAYALAAPGQAVVPRIDLGSPKANVRAIYARFLAN